MRFAYLYLFLKRYYFHIEACHAQRNQCNSWKRRITCIKHSFEQQGIYSQYIYSSKKAMHTVNNFKMWDKIRPW